MVAIYLVSSRALTAQADEKMDRIGNKTAELDLWIGSRERDAVNISELPFWADVCAGRKSAAAAHAEECASAAEGMSAQSEALKKTVERLTAMVNGSQPLVHRAAGFKARLPAARMMRAFRAGGGKRSRAMPRARVGRSLDAPLSRLSIEDRLPAGYHEKLC